MEYGDAIKQMDPSLTVKQRFYEVYIEPYLKEKPHSDNLAYLLDQAYNAWRLDIKPVDVKNMLFVEWMCRESAKNNESDFVKLISRLLSQTHDTAIRSEIADRNVYDSRKSKDIERIFGDTIRLYKVYFENEFRLWATIPYYYACNNYKIKNSATDPESYVSIGASEKFHPLKNIKLPLPRGNLKDLTEGFDNEIRNAGEGHDLWEITDNETMLLQIINPKTGLPKGSKKIELNISELNDLVKLCRKTIWVLKMGTTVFLNNNPNFVAKLQQDRNLKIKEVEKHLMRFAEDRWIGVKNFKINKKRTDIQIGLKYEPRIIGEQGQVFFGKAERYDLVKIENKVKYKNQVLGIIQYLLVSCFDKDKLPKLHLKIFNKNDKCIGNLKYSPAELKKLFLKKNKKNIPIPSKGKMPEDEYILTYEIRVPFGTRELFEKKLKSMNKKLINDKFGEE